MKMKTPAKENISINIKQRKPSLSESVVMANHPAFQKQRKSTQRSSIKVQKSSIQKVPS